MTLAALIAYLGVIAGVVVLWQMATQRMLSLPRPGCGAGPGRTQSDTIPAKRPDPWRFI